MQIHQLKLKTRKKKKTIGRGGKRGTTSGRGTKGQGAHGKHKSPLFEGGRSSLIERMKKVRGFKAVGGKAFTVTLDMLEENFKAGERVSRDTLVSNKVFGKLVRVRGAKIVASGTLKKKLTIGKDVDASAGAIEAMKKAGATIEE